MKKKFYSLLFTATMAVAAAYAAEPVPYEYTFSGGSLGEWTQVDNTGAYPSWSGHQNGAAISIEVGISNDDYLVSPEIALQSGKTYQVSVAIHEKAYTMDAATLNVAYGTGSDIASFADAGEVTLTAGSTPSVLLTVPSDGNYKIALHCTSTGGYDFGSGQIFVSSVSVTDAEEGGSGDEPQSVAVPYEYTFSSATFDEGWSKYDANDDSYEWSATSNYVYSYLGYYGYGTESSDDYLFSPLFSLEAGTNYVITVNMPDNNPYMNEQTNVDVMFGTSNDGTGYTSIGKLEINPGGSSTISFSVPQSGDYKIAFHDTSAPEMYGTTGIYLTSFSIAPGEEGGDTPQGVAVPYDYTFSSTTFDEGWSKQNVNGDGYEWSASSAYVYSYIAYGTNNDYLFSPAFALEAGKNYSVTVAMNDYTTNNGETVIDVMYGTGNDGAAYTSIGKLEINPGGTSTVTFSVPQNGDYQIAFHDTSSSNGTSSIYLTSFSIAPDEGGGDTPAEVAEMPYSIDFSTTDWTGKWNASDLDGDGRTWGYNSDYSTDGYAQTRCNSNGTNDWLVSPLFHFEEGREYEITVLARQNSSNMASEYTNLAVKVMFGDQNYSPAKEIGTVNPLDIVLVKPNTFKFTADVTGDFPVSIVNASTGESIILNVANFSIAPTSGQGSSTELKLPYSYDFKTNALGEWETFDANGDNVTWGENSFKGYGVCVKDVSSSNSSDDDYLVSPGTFSLEAGKIYTATLALGSFSNVGTENNIDLVMGSGEDFTQYETIDSFTLTEETKKNGSTTINFTVDKAGSYRIGLHNHSVGAIWYIEKFDLSEYTAPELPEGVLLDKDFNDGVDMGWSILDENNDENSWKFVDGLSGISLTSVRGAQGNHNDWLISPEMAFEAGKSYVVTYTASTSGNSAPATLTVAYGSAPDAASMTNTIATRTINETDTAYFRITPETAGNYYLGFLVNSSANNGTVSVLTVKVAESAGITPLAPAGLAAEPDIQAGEVKLSWTNPVTDTENIALDGNITLRISRNGETVTDVTGQPGEAMSYIDRPTLFEGEAKYQVAAYVTEDKLSEAAETVANLNDFQGERNELYSWGGTYGSGFDKWTVINKNGGNTWTHPVTYFDDYWEINYGKPSDDWLISPEVALTTGRRYVIEVQVKSGTNQPAELELYTGQGTSIADMKNFVCDITAEGNGTLTYTSEQFTVDADGDYNLGVRAVSISTHTTLNRYTIYYYENRDTDPEEVPYTEDFADADLAGWSFADGSTFAVADGALTSSQNGEPRSEIVYSPLINLKGGYTYEVTFDYAFDGADDGSTFTFYMADGQSETELIADSRLALDGTADGRCLFTPDEDGSYCLAWQIIAGADDDVKATIDNLAVGVNIYSALPYSEDFEGFAINEIPVGYKGITTVSDDNGNIAAKISAESGASLWFNYEQLRETYSLTLKYKKSDISGWKINAVTAEGEKQLVGSIEGDANADWKEVTFAIPTFAGKEEAYGFRLEFSTFGESSLLIDDLQITLNERAIAPAAPTEFRVYKNASEPDMAAWTYPTTKPDGNPLDSNANVTVTIYEDNTAIGSATGTPGSNGAIAFTIDDNWDNGVKLYRAVASIDDEQGEAATWIVMENDATIYGFNGNTLSLVKYDFSSDEDWTADGWTIAGGIASAAPGEGTATITSPEFELTEGQLYMVRYYIDTDANSPADFTVTVGDASQEFTKAYIGRNTYSWNVFDPSDPNYQLGRYMHIDFMLPRIETTGNYDVTISASNIGKNISVESVEVLEVREYPTVCEVPYENDFDDMAAPSGSPEPNWTIPFYTQFWRIDEMANYDGATAASGSRALVAPPTTELASTAPQDFIFTPYFAVKAGKTYLVEFDYYMPSAETGLAFIYANTPTYAEDEYAVIKEMEQATAWKHYSINFKNTGVDGELVFGFVSYAAEVRDQVTAIDNFKITEESAPGSVSEIAADAAVTYHDGMLNVPADIESVAVYDMQGRMVISTTETGTISLEGLSDGVYVVKAVGTEGGAVQTLKIVK